MAGKSNPPPHRHTQDKFIRSYQRETGARDAKGNMTYRTVMVWGCPCGSGPTSETS